MSQDFAYIYRNARLNGCLITIANYIPFLSSVDKKIEDKVLTLIKLNPPNPKNWSSQKFSHSYRYNYGKYISNLPKKTALQTYICVL